MNASGRPDPAGGRRWTLGVLVVVLTVAVAGCVGPGGSASPVTDTAAPTDAPASTATSTDPPGPTTTSTDVATTTDATGSTSETVPPEFERRTATVDRVVDGDTVVVTFEDGTRETVRLLGVDTPEIHSANSPGEFEGVPDTPEGSSCLREWGDLAHAVAIEALSGEEVQVVFDPDSDRRGYYGRLLAYLYVDGTSFNRELVVEGYARVYESDFTRLDAYLDAERGARNRGDGLWECTTVESTSSSPATGDSALVVEGVNYDAPGNDNDNLNEEYVTFRNAGDEPLDVSGWTVSDEADHTYRFPEGTVLDPGDRVTLHTGSGPDTDADRYWGQGRAVWNNGGDVVTVRNASGAVVLRYTYGDAGAVAPDVVPSAGAVGPAAVTRPSYV